MLLHERKKDWEETVEQPKISITFSKTCVTQLNQCAEENFVILNVILKRKTIEK